MLELSIHPPSSTLGNPACSSSIHLKGTPHGRVERYTEFQGRVPSPCSCAQSCPLFFTGEQTRGLPLWQCERIPYFNICSICPSLVHHFEWRESKTFSGKHVFVSILYPSPQLWTNVLHTEGNFKDLHHLDWSNTANSQSSQSSKSEHVLWGRQLKKPKQLFWPHSVPLQATHHTNQWTKSYSQKDATNIWQTSW